MKKENLIKFFVLAAAAVVAGALALLSFKESLSPVYAILVLGFGVLLASLYECYVRIQHNIDAKNDILRTSLYPTKAAIDRAMAEQNRKIGLIVELLEKLLSYIEEHRSVLASSDVIASMQTLKKTLDEMSADDLKISEKIVALIHEVSTQR